MTELGNNRIQKFTGDGQLSSPSGIVLDSAGSQVFIHVGDEPLAQKANANGLEGQEDYSKWTLLYNNSTSERRSLNTDYGRLNLRQYTAQFDCILYRKRSRSPSEKSSFSPSTMKLSYRITAKATKSTHAFSSELLLNARTENECTLVSEV